MNDRLYDLSDLLLEILAMLEPEPAEGAYQQPDSENSDDLGA